MGADLAGKRVLVLSDNDGLSRAIELNLKHNHLEVIRLALSSPRGRCPELVEGQGSQAEVGYFDLIVVAMSSSTSEPVVALARTSLAGRIGQVPLLIISDRPFHSNPDDQITHLDFPFDIDGLHDKVREILQRDPADFDGCPSPALESATCSKANELKPLIVEGKKMDNFLSDRPRWGPDMP